VYDDLGEKQKALDYYRQALPISRQVGDRFGEATTLNNIGHVYDDLGERHKALDYCNQALPIIRQVGDRFGEAAIINNIGHVYDELGEKQKALDYYNEALQITDQVGARSVQAGTLNNIGYVYSSLGEEQRALDYYHHALPILRQVGDRSGEATTLNNIGYVYSSLGQKQKALDCFNQALPIILEVGDRSAEATTLNNIGVAYESLEERQKALEYYGKALRIILEVGNRSLGATTVNNIGHLYYGLGEKQKAREYCNLAASTTREVGDRLGEATALSLASAAERDLGRLADAKAHIEAALDIIESVRGKLAGSDFRSSFVNSVQSYYTLCVDVLMQMHKKRPSEGFDTAALKASERGRARSLLDMLIESRADIREGVDSDLLERERALQSQLAALSSRHIELYSKQGSEDEQKALDKQIDRLDGQYQEVEAAIRSKSPRYAALAQPEPLDLKQIQQRVLDGETLLLEYSIGPERSYMWVVGPNSIASHDLPGAPIVELLAKLFALRTARGGQDQSSRAAPVNEDPEYRANALRLSAILLGPAAGSLGNKRLLIVADGALEYVPFAALPDPSVSGNEDPENPLVPLLAKHEIVTAPSASAIDVERRELKGREPAPKAVAILADPVFSPSDPRVKAPAPKTQEQPFLEARIPDLRQMLFGRAAKDASDLGLLRGGTGFQPLPKTKYEADKIASLVADGQYKEALNFDASKPTAKATDMTGYRYVHFATHGVINALHPELTGVLLSMVDESGRSADGFLTTNEVYNLKLPAEMVVLSACQTALGEQVKGEGLVGLTRGFMYAGAARVVASLWKVDDDATAELMIRFYRSVLKEGMRPAAALRAAQLDMWRQKEYRDPFYWAAFELQGEWK
jgi:CHAT domain-containing protein/Tfp pilus assembly protein PilF